MICAQLLSFVVQRFARITWIYKISLLKLGVIQSQAGLHKEQMMREELVKDDAQFGEDLEESENKIEIGYRALGGGASNRRDVPEESKMITGDENNITVAIYGRNGALKWEQENPNYLYFLKDDEPRRLIKPGNVYNTDVSLDGTKLPAGHPEAWVRVAQADGVGLPEAAAGDQGHGGGRGSLVESEGGAGAAHCHLGPGGGGVRKDCERRKVGGIGRSDEQRRGGR